MLHFKFGPPSQEERFVFGAQRPGYPSTSVSTQDVQTWISFMKGQGIHRVCCLLTPSQLSYYEDDLLDMYRHEFGPDNVCWAPIDDFHLSEEATLQARILPFLKESVDRKEPVVVHCSSGSGRTGHVLAAWLVCAHNARVEDALAAVTATNRNPYEAVQAGNATLDELHALLDLRS